MAPEETLDQRTVNNACTFDLLQVSPLGALGVAQEIGTTVIPKEVATESTGVEPLPKETGTSHAEGA
jgi:hypothetical protein